MELSDLRPQDELCSTLRRAVELAKGEDGMAPVNVLVPNAVSGQSLRRRLGSTGGLVNVRFMTAEHLADVICDEARDGLELDESLESPRLTNDLKRELTRLVATEALSPLDTQIHGELVQLLSIAFHRLRRLSWAEVDSLADGGPLAKELVRLYKRFRLAASAFRDDRDRVEAATSVVSTDTTPVIALIAEPPPLDVDTLLHVLAEHDRLQTVAICSGDPILDTSLKRSLWGLADIAFVDPPMDPNRVERILIAPDAQTEIQLVVGSVFEQASQGIPFPRMAILFGKGSSYGFSVHQRLAEAGIPWSGGPSIRLDQSAAGRFVLSLLALVDEDFSLGAIRRWLSSCDLRRNEMGELVPADLWGWIATAAKVQTGPIDMKARLETYASRVATGEIASRPNLSREASDLATFLGEVALSVNEMPSSWKGWTRWILNAMERYLGPEEARATWPANELQAVIDIEHVLQEMNRLDDLGSDVDLMIFSAAISDNLLGFQQRSTVSTGVFVGTLHEAVGSDFDVSFICGMSEGTLPRPENEGVLEVLRMPAEEGTFESQWRSFLLALRSASRIELSCPRTDQRAQRPARPSPWLLSRAAGLAGRPVSADELVKGAQDWPWLRNVASFSETLSAPGLGINDSLDMLRSLSNLREIDHEDLPREISNALSIAGERRSEGAGAADGIVGPHDLLSLSEPVAPTNLENWGQCPFRYFLKTVLGIAEPLEQDDPFELAAKDRGKLLHLVLERFLKSVPKKLHPNETWSVAEKAELHSVAGRVCAEIEAAGSAPGGLLWDVERDQLHGQLDDFLLRDEEVRSAYGVTTSDVELEFGRNGNDAVVIPRDGKAPVRFRGRIDRVDTSPDGSRMISFDYKTGKSDAFSGIERDPVDGGTKLQLAVYSEAAEAYARSQGFPVEHVEAGYWFLTDSARRYPIRSITAGESNKTRWRGAIATIADGIEGGIFPQVPGDEVLGSYSNCRRCPYDEVCPSERGEAWERKSTDPSVALFHEVKADPIEL